MRKISILIILSSIVQILPAQFYINLNTGYSLSTQPLIHENTIVTDTIMDQFRIKFSYGSGLNLGINLGYRFTENLFAEISMNTSLYSRSRSDNDWGYYFRRDYEKLHLSGLNGDALMKKTSLQVAPLLGFSAGDGRVRPFIKAGVNILYLKSRYSNNYTYKYFDENSGWYLEFTQLKRVYTGHIRAGFRGTAGVLYKITDKFTLTAELTAVNSMYYFNTSRTLTFKVDGVEEVDDLDENPEKLDRGQGTIDFSNIGINLGVTLNL